MLKAFIICLSVVFLSVSAYSQPGTKGQFSTINLLKQIDSLSGVVTSLKDTIREKESSLQNSKYYISEQQFNWQKAKELLWELQELERQQELLEQQIQQAKTPQEKQFLKSNRYISSLSIDEDVLGVLVDKYNDSLVNRLLEHYPILNLLYQAKTFAVYVQMKAGVGVPEVVTPKKIVSSTVIIGTKASQLQQQLSKLKLLSSKMQCAKELVNKYLADEATVTSKNINRIIGDRNFLLQYIQTNCKN